jgi:hypothetical protein
MKTSEYGLLHMLLSGAPGNTVPRCLSTMSLSPTACELKPLGVIRKAATKLLRASPKLLGHLSREVPFTLTTRFLSPWEGAVTFLLDDKGQVSKYDYAGYCDWPLGREHRSFRPDNF